MESEGARERSINFSSSQQDLSQRIEDFHSQRPEDVEELRNYIQGVLEEAETTAQERLDIKAVSVIDNAKPSIDIRVHKMFPLAERGGKREESERVHVGLEGQEQASRYTRPKPRSFSYRHDLQLHQQRIEPDTAGSDAIETPTNCLREKLEHPKAADQIRGLKWEKARFSLSPISMHKKIFLEKYSRLTR
jgi:hypothetical protein